jgi:hypothetical protein
MTAIRWLAIVAILALPCGLRAARAQEEEGEEREPMARRISVEFKETAFVKCLEELSKKSGVNMVAAQRVIKEMGKTPVTFAVKDTAIWSVVHLFARSCGLEVSHEDGGFIFSKPVKPQDVWAKLKIEVDDGKIEIVILRGDVAAMMRRQVLHRILEERFEEHEEEEHDGDDDAEARERAEAKGREKKPAREDAPRKPAKGELF